VSTERIAQAPIEPGTMIGARLVDKGASEVCPRQPATEPML